MPSLVSNFIINPVLRQARRFSSGFATEEPPATIRHHRTRSDGGEAGSAADDAILELDGEGSGRIPDTRRSRTSSLSIAQPPIPGPRTSSRRNTLNRPPAGELSSANTAQDSQTPTQPRTQNNSGDVGTAGLGWIDETSRNTPLPEDDGNGELRQKILAIQAMSVSQTLKAQLVHQLLMEGYNKRRAPPTSPTLNPESPTGRSVQDRREAEPSGALQQALKFLNPLGDGNGPLDLPLTDADLRKTYVPNAPPPDEDLVARVEKMGIEDHGQPVLGCEHYRRNVKMQCATCEKWYTCRFCHDAVEDHILPRQDTKHMLCMLCGCAQKASDACVGCGESAAYYFCGVCKLWNDDPNKSIYHCNDCGLCRVGQGLGKDFFHCKKCMACISMTTGHKCIERSIDCDCPICGEYMFNSPRPVIFMQCGHSIHRRCFEQHMQSSYKCPLCNKSCVNMDAQFRSFDMAILTQPMPPEYNDARAIVSCNDCSAKSQTAYHWLGLKCSLCSSYNTIQLQLLNMPGQDRDQNPSSTRSQPGTVRIPPARRLSDLAAEALPDIAALARQLRRRNRPAPSDRPASPSILSRLFLQRGNSNGTSNSATAAGGGLVRSVSPSPDHLTPASASAPAVAGPLAVLAMISSDDDLPSQAQPVRDRGLVRALGSDDSEEEDEEDEDMLDFWGRSGDDARGVTSDGGVEFGEEDEDEEEEEESSSSEEEDGCDEEDDEEEEIVLFGHR
ncbi:putative RING finger protein [Podospora aff. communis PSN243]|uniref:RING finger protein n=1 Tax=Podospora aff. communis PSN243 TaxID=3040156 RepID=A0AAV9H4J1_9PEZI|nr:putative RING finger protein [Podospora aff. communis PSN243]